MCVDNLTVVDGDDALCCPVSEPVQGVLKGGKVWNTIIDIIIVISIMKSSTYTHEQ